MNQKAVSIRPFIGAKDYQLSRSFYRDLGFQETVISPQMSLFGMDHIAFYLQDFYVRDWIDNTMVFCEVDDVDRYWTELVELDLTTKYPTAKVIPVRELDWGKECFVQDPAGVLWHFGEFNSKSL